MFYLLIDITANMTFPIHSVQTTTPTGHMQFLHFSWAAARTFIWQQAHNYGGLDWK